MNGDRRANRTLNGKSCGVERAETEVEVVPTTRRTAGVFDQNPGVYHDAADTNPQTDVSVLWTTADEVLKFQRGQVSQQETELIDARAQVRHTEHCARSSPF